MKSIKEKQLLVKWSRVMGTEIDPALVVEVERYEQIQKEVLDSVRNNSVKDLAEAASLSVNTFEEKDYPKPPTLDQVLELLKEAEDELVQTQTIKEPTQTTQHPLSKPTTLAELAAEAISRDIKEEQSFQQPVVTTVDRNFEAVTQKLKYLEQFIAKIAAHGPGGGAGDVINLDHPVKLVTANYTITRKDYYVGVNAASAVTITLPDSIGFPGRKVVIKDESGNCSSNPITVLGNVDNDPGGFILQMDNGGIQMIYREGWRII